MADTEELHCNCGGTLKKGRVPYKDTAFEGLICSGCGEKGFTMEQYEIAFKQKQEYDKKEKLKQQEKMLLKQNGVSHCC